MGNRAFRGVRDKSEQMDEKENSLALMPSERMELNRRETRRSADEEEAGSIGRKPM